MASRLRSFSRPATTFLRSTSSSAARNPSSTPAASLFRSLPPLPRSSAVRRMGLARSLQPLHSAVSAARLTSRLGPEAAGMARAMLQETGIGAPR